MKKEIDRALLQQILESSLQIKMTEKVVRSKKKYTRKKKHKKDADKEM